MSYTASSDEIKRAYRRLAKEFHPDVSADEASTEFAMFLNDVYEVWRGGGRSRQSALAAHSLMVGLAPVDSHRSRMHVPRAQPPPPSLRCSTRR